jgi:hypothetical protein
MWTTHQVARADRIPLRQPRIDELTLPLSRRADPSPKPRVLDDFPEFWDETIEESFRKTKEKRL